jgi:tetratricopeptide (TPR) repeat protein
MYGVWNADADANRNKARIELIQFLLKKGAPEKAESELMALATALPADPADHLRAAQLFAQAQDYPGELVQCREALRQEETNSAALACAGQAAYLSGSYAQAQRYLREAVNADSHDEDSRRLLETTDLIIRSNPFHSHISDAERNRRISAAFEQAEARLSRCTTQKRADLNATSGPPQLDILQSRWAAMKPDLARLRSPAETDLPDSIMDIVFQIEQQTAALCGQPQGPDLALLLISQKREAASQ